MKKKTFDSFFFFYLVSRWGYQQYDGSVFARGEYNGNLTFQTSVSCVQAIN